MKQAALAGFDRTSKEGTTKWAAALLAHNLLLRGGEVGQTDKRGWDPTRGLTLASFSFKDPSKDSSGCPWLLIRIVAIKDAKGTNKAVLIPVRRRSSYRSQPHRRADPLDTYDAIKAAWHIRRAKVDVADTDTAPFFTGRSGRTWTTSDTRELAQSIGQAAGLQPDTLGAKSSRIGGATDLQEHKGEVAAHDIIQQRGRWSSDIAAVYRRPLIRQHLLASAALGDTEGSRDLEDYVEAWSHPPSPISHMCTLGCHCFEYQG